MATVTTTSPPHRANLAPQDTLSSLQDAVAHHQDTLLLIARAAMAYIFIESALNHATNLAGFAATFKNFQLPEVFGVPVAALAVIVELVGGITLLLGWRVRETAVLMIVFLLITIFVGHRYWEFEGPARRLHIIQIKKNIAIIGGFLAVLVIGGGRYALSAWLEDRKR